MPDRCKYCTPPGDFDPLNVGSFIGPILVFLGGLLAAFVTGPVGIIVAFIGAWWALQKACAFLRGGKLICLRKFECAIGRVVELEPVGHHKSGFDRIDNDYSANLLLAPHLPGAVRSTIEGNGGQGRFIAEQPQTAGLGLKFVGYTTHKPATLNKPYELNIPVLHAEFEGNRVCTFCDAASAAMAVLAVGAAICAIPIIGWIACLFVLAVAAAIVAALLIDGWNGAHDGDPNDAAVNPGDGSLSAMDADCKGGDYVVIRGDWVYDAGHDGWNEIHPVQSVQKIPDAPYWAEGGGTDTVATFDGIYARWCRETGRPDRPAVQEEQKEPRNRWCVHPELDGCAEEEEDDVPQPH